MMRMEPITARGHGPLRVTALLGQRRGGVPAGDREDREHDTEEQSVRVGAVEGVSQCRLTPPAPGWRSR